MLSVPNYRTSPLWRPEIGNQCVQIPWPRGNCGLGYCGYTMMWKKAQILSSLFVLSGSKRVIEFGLVER